jgi:hypothetical protein
MASLNLSRLFRVGWMAGVAGSIRLIWSLKPASKPVRNEQWMMRRMSDA